MQRKPDNPGIRFALTHAVREHPILALQKTAGNQAVIRWLRTPPPSEPAPPAPRPPERVWPKVIPAAVVIVIVAYGVYTYFIR